MGASVNKAIVLGRLGADPTVRFTQSGKAVASFSLATSESWKDDSGEKKEKTEWHNVIAWGKLGELAGQYLKKGSQVYVEGKLQTRSWEDEHAVKRWTTEIVAGQICFLGSKGDLTKRESPAPLDDDIPF